MYYKRPGEHWRSKENQACILLHALAGGALVYKCYHSKVVSLNTWDLFPDISAVILQKEVSDSFWKIEFLREFLFLR